MIVYDTETTGLIQNSLVGLDYSPEIIEFCAVKLHDDTLEEVTSLELLIKPSKLPLPDKVVQVTGITDAMLADALSFARHLPKIQAFFLGERTLVAHNAPYDVSMLEFELKRLDRVKKFPWPSEHLCTVQLNIDLLGKRMNLGDLYEHATGKKIEGAHRAINDVRATAEIVRWMRAEGRL